MLEANEIEQDMMWFYILMLVVLFAAFRSPRDTDLGQKMPLLPDVVKTTSSTVT